MATAPLGGSLSPVTFPNHLPPMPAVQSVLLRYARHDRETLEAFLSMEIELVDIIHGDPDLENATDLEGDFTLTRLALDYADDGAGCGDRDEGH